MTEKQKTWFKRSRLIWRVKGMYLPVDKEIMTEEEIEKVKLINSTLRSLSDNFTDNSIKLGFNAKVRCDFINCKRGAKHRISSYNGQQNLCKEHYNEFLNDTGK